jgi:uncharacterized protein YjgD (DUF1641 family)
MANNNIEQQLSVINQKLDTINEQMEQYQLRQRELQELKNDLTIIGKDIFNAAIEELNDVAPYFDSSDLVFLFKKLLRNTRNINQILTQMESAEDLFNDLKPLSKKIFDDLLQTLNELDRKGYFEFLKESFKIFDTVVTSFTIDDVKLLRENIASILLTVKSMTQPEMLATINNALGFFRKMDIEIEKEKMSYFAIFKQLKDPEVKRGFVFMLEFVKSMANAQEEMAVQ